MEPPSYEEASLHPPPLTTEGLNIPPPPSYDASLSSPATPPPTYGEAVKHKANVLTFIHSAGDLVTIQPDPFQPSVPAAVTSPPQNTDNVIHPHTRVGVRSALNGRQTQPVVVVTQPTPVPILVTCLRDSPALVCCPHCHHTVTTKVIYLPGRAAWCLCVLLTLMGLVCGFCLIPFMVRGLQDAHHSCPRCGNHLHVYTR